VTNATVVDALRIGAIVARADVAVVTLTGPGAVSCFQGLLTNDIEKPGDGAFVYGALLTPKGMILADGWAARRGASVAYVVPVEARARVLELYGRSIPPRLARAADRSEDVTVLRIAGAGAAALSEAAGVPLPAPGRVVETEVHGVPVEVARPGEAAPFALQLAAAPGHALALEERLAAAGALRPGASGLELARILAGWPRLGAEVDDKTLPQEVRYDEIGGVSYTKGCYTGQETVSRLHFRGHPNRELKGLEFDAEPDVKTVPVVVHRDKEVGRVTSVAWLPDGGGSPDGRWIGLGILRREVAPGDMVRAGGTDARVLALPFALRRHEPA
jgi:folate-binding protein YgfZ